MMVSTDRGDATAPIVHSSLAYLSECTFGWALLVAKATNKLPTTYSLVVIVQDGAVAADECECKKRQCRVASEDRLETPC